ncbi:hypothetical protein [Flavobacterium sandaracinum]|uniref:Uncharacterized protein n=1 Tax=Flavobacterium sandaracinum TaxID=2541733 RepID=A0A4R5CUK6_9FLAO|nr:hypothetical protein [Flavobacterium sandaracinum]TDE01525.1 hypothetical protein E0F91_14315 [Flavobacterium sandaracinum]
MSKTSKITVKHFLNTNLKPYLINGVKHYSIYLLLVAFRQNTKVKSITFNEYYSEENFNEIFNSTDDFDKDLINNEINAITLISEIVTKELKEFDTAFITAYFKYCTTVSISNLNEYYYLTTAKIQDDLIDFNLRDFILENNIHQKTLFNYFGNTMQKQFQNYLKKNLKVKDLENITMLFNTAYFYESLEGFKESISKTKNSYLIDKYDKSFYLISNIKQKINNDYFTKKHGTDDEIFNKYLK